MCDTGGGGKVGSPCAITLPSLSKYPTLIHSNALSRRWTWYSLPVTFDEVVEQAIAEAKRVVSEIDQMLAAEDPFLPPPPKPRPHLWLVPHPDEVGDE